MQTPHALGEVPDSSTSFKTFSNGKKVSFENFASEILVLFFLQISMDVIDISASEIQKYVENDLK